MDVYDAAGHSAQNMSRKLSELVNTRRGTNRSVDCEYTVNDFSHRPDILLPTCLELRSWRHRKLAVRWHLGNFPRHYRYLRKIGLQGLLDELKVLSGSKVSRGVNIRICAALAGNTAIDERK